MTDEEFNDAISRLTPPQLEIVEEAARRALTAFASTSASDFGVDYQRIAEDRRELSRLKTKLVYLKKQVDAWSALEDFTTKESILERIRQVVSN